MKNYKNYLIALLVVLLGASLTIQPSQGAGTSKEAKIQKVFLKLLVFLPWSKS